MKSIFLTLLLMLSSSCTRVPLESKENAMRPASPLKLMDDLPLDSLQQNLENQIAWLEKTGTNAPLSFGPSSIPRVSYAQALSELLEVVKTQPSKEVIETYINEHFEWYEVYGDQSWGEVKLTSYFMPIIPGSKVKTEKFSEAFLKKPDDLLTILTGRYWEPIDDIGTMRGRPLKGDPKRIIPYYSRQEIYGGVLASDNLELVWVDPIDAFITHIQGSGTVEFEDGSHIRYGYADQNGHPYVAIGKFLFDIIPKEEMTLARIEEHLRTLSIEDLLIFLAQNPSFIFFRQLDDEALTANTTPVQDGRTIATDAKFFPKGALAVLSFEKPQMADPKSEAEKVTRLVFDQDTGGAIKGGGRVDLFWGKGKEARRWAGSINQTGSLHYLVPKKHTQKGPTD